MAATFTGKVYKHFEDVTDPRVERITNHELIEMIFIALCAAICDANTWADVERFGKAKVDWLRKYIRLENGVPSHDTFSRVFARLDTSEFNAALQAWALDLAGCLRDQTVAVDGKTLRHSFDKAAEQAPLHSVTAWASGLKLCLGALAVDSKSNEIPAVQNLIELLDLRGSIVTADAMHCQKQTCQGIIDREADYILFVKGNQRKLLESIQDLLFDAIDDKQLRAKMRTHSEEGRNRNRDEFRQTVTMPCPSDHPVFSAWPGIKTIGQVVRHREVDGKLSEESAYFISSRGPQVRDMAKRLRSHWSIENSQHHVLDVTFSEDASRIRKGNGPEISSIFRRLALNILQQDSSIKDSIRGKRKRCGWDERTFDRLLQAF